MIGGRGSSGRESLIVATSNAGFASGAIGFGAGGGSGIVHAVSALARVKVNGVVCDERVQVPIKPFPSPLNLPSYVPPIPGNTILTLESCTGAALPGMLVAPRSMLYM